MERDKWALVLWEFEKVPLAGVLGVEVVFESGASSIVTSLRLVETEWIRAMVEDPEEVKIYVSGAI